MATILTEYLTNAGDRLDTIAGKAYGDPFNWLPILDANPSLPIQDGYPAGVRLIIPVQQRGTGRVNSSLLPPWKRNGASA
jgi:nucleoid-associated protein YgaU